MSIPVSQCPRRSLKATIFAPFIFQAGFEQLHWYAIHRHRVNYTRASCQSILNKPLFISFFEDAPGVVRNRDIVDNLKMPDNFDRRAR